MDNNHSLRSIFFDNADVFCFLFDKRLNVIDANKAALHLVQLPLEQLMGKNMVEISPDVKLEGRFEMYMEVIRTGNAIVIDEAKLHPSYGNVYSRIKAFKVGEGLGLMATNITDLVNVVDEIDNFVSKSSQEMRSPIASILGLASIAKNNVNEPDTLGNYLKMIKTEALKLDGTLQKLLKVTKLHQNKSTVCLIDFNLLFNNVIHSLSFVDGFEQVRFDLQNTSRIEFYGEINLLATLFQNLLDNTIKYRRLDSDNCFVNITIQDSRLGVLITIVDNGIGIADENHSEVFKMFYRATTQGSGSGLGLYTVKHHIATLKGSVNLSSQENEGTTFEIYLPTMKQA